MVLAFCLLCMVVLNNVYFFNFLVQTNNAKYSLFEYTRLFACLQIHYFLNEIGIY